MPAGTAAKAAVEGPAKGMARDLGPDKIRVVTVIPGWIAMRRRIDPWLTPKAEAEPLKPRCLNEKLYPPDLARMVLWLASDASRMCAGQLWVVDGGWMWRSFPS